MNRKTLSAAILTLATMLSAPLVQADRRGYDDRRDNYREVRVVHHVEKHYYRHDHGYHRGWHKPRRHGYHNYRGPEYRHPAPSHGYPGHYPAQRASSSTPIIVGGVIGGVVGHEIGRGDPRDTAVGAVIGTIIGYEIVRNRDY